MSDIHALDLKYINQRQKCIQSIRNDMSDRFTSKYLDQLCIHAFKKEKSEYLQIELFYSKKNTIEFAGLFQK